MRKFTGGVPARITLVNKLTGLYLQNNSFSGALPQQIWRMASLEYLHANDNQVPGPNPKPHPNPNPNPNPKPNPGPSLNPNPNPTNNPTPNQLVGPIPHGLGYLSSLRSLRLENNMVEATTP